VHHSAGESRVCMRVVFSSSQSSSLGLRRRKMPLDVVCAWGACGVCAACIGPERRRDSEKAEALASQRREGLLRAQATARSEDAVRKQVKETKCAISAEFIARAVRKRDGACFAAAGSPARSQDKFKFGSLRLVLGISVRKRRFRNSTSNGPR
jgi:hypothetical protein